MRKLGLFTNFQFDDNFHHIYQDSIKSLVAKRKHGIVAPEIELIGVLPQGTDFIRDNTTINTGLFESCFRSSIEYAINVLHCEVIAFCFRDTYLHSLAEEVFAEDERTDGEAQVVSLAECAITVCEKRKRLKNLGLLSITDVREDNLTRERFQAHGYQIMSPFNDEQLAELNRQAIMLNSAEKPEDIDIDNLRHVCGTIEQVTKAEKINGLLALGYFDLCEVLAQGGLAIPVINLVEEHIKAITEAILS